MKFQTRMNLSILRPIIMCGHELFNSKINTQPLEKSERYWLRRSRRMGKDDKQVLYKTYPSFPWTDIFKIERHNIYSRLKTRNLHILTILYKQTTGY